MLQVTGIKCNASDYCKIKWSVDLTEIKFNLGKHEQTFIRQK